MELKDRIKELRMQKNLTTSQLAVAFNKSEGAVRAWETGRSMPDAITLIELAKYCGVTSDYLLGLSNLRNKNEAFLLLDNFEEFTNMINEFPENKKADVVLTLQAILIMLLPLERNETLYDQFLKSFKSMLCLFKNVLDPFTYIIENLHNQNKEYDNDLYDFIYSYIRLPDDICKTLIPFAVLLEENLSDEIYSNPESSTQKMFDILKKVLDR